MDKLSDEDKKLILDGLTTLAALYTRQLHHLDVDNVEHYRKSLLKIQSLRFDLEGRKIYVE